MKRDLSELAITLFLFILSLVLTLLISLFPEYDGGLYYRDGINNQMIFSKFSYYIFVELHSHLQQGLTFHNTIIFLLF